MESIVLAIHVVLAVAIVALVLVQQGKGSSIGASFGGGSSNTVFGSQGSFSFFAKLTSGAIALFFVTSLVLAWVAQREFYGQSSDVNQLLETIQEKATRGETLPGETLPVAPDTAEPKAPEQIELPTE